MKIPIVNEQDQVIKYVEKKDRKPEEIIRVSGIWITNEKGEILLAQRAFSKKYDPGLWGPAVAGTVEEGETYESNAIKEAEEEIGLIGATFVPRDKIRGSYQNEFFVQMFTAVVDSKYPFVKQDLEVEKIGWFTKEELVSLFSKNPKTFIPEFSNVLQYCLAYENKN